MKEYHYTLTIDHYMPSMKVTVTAESRDKARKLVAEEYPAQKITEKPTGRVIQTDSEPESKSVTLDVS